MQLDMLEQSEIVVGPNLSREGEPTISLSEAFRVARLLTLPAIEEGTETPLQMIVAALATHQE